jgi:hypothetical protein
MHGVGAKTVKVSKYTQILRGQKCAELKRGCLKLTKAMQKTSETLQSVADLYEDHVRLQSDRHCSDQLRCDIAGKADSARYTRVAQGCGASLFII